MDMIPSASRMGVRAALVQGSSGNARVTGLGDGSPPVMRSGSFLVRLWRRDSEPRVVVQHIRSGATLRGSSLAVAMAWMSAGRPTPRSDRSARTHAFAPRQRRASQLMVDKGVGMTGDRPQMASHAFGRQRP